LARVAFLRRSLRPGISSVSANFVIDFCLWWFGQIPSGPQPIIEQIGSLLRKCKAKA
jgi:hypothetical protein